MTSHRITLAIAIAAGIALAGCGKSASDSSAEATIKAATGGKVDISKSGDQVTIKTDQGVATVNSGGNVPLPKDFPSDVHLPSSYTIKSAMQMGPMVALTLHTPAAMQAVYSDYDSSMKSGGWTEAMAMQTSDKESMLTFQKDKRNVVVAITSSSDAGGGSDVSVQSTSEQK